MSRRREDRAISKHTLNLYAGDYARLQALYPIRIGAAKVIRDIIHAHIRMVEESAAQRVPLIAELDIQNIDEENIDEEEELDE